MQASQNGTLGKGKTLNPEDIHISDIIICKKLTFDVKRFFSSVNIFP